MTQDPDVRGAEMATCTPLVTLITINYNSLPRIDIVLSCFKAMLELRWRPIQLVYVDNGSKDGSFDKIKEFAKAHAEDSMDLVFLSLPANLGFARANNEGLKAANPSSKYVLVMNNDLAPEGDSLGCLIDFLESRPSFAGVQPIVMDWSGLKINVAGCVFTVWGASGLGGGLPMSFVTDPFLVSHLYGAFSIYRRSAIEKSGGLFLPYFFMYGDDYELGVRLWSAGYKLGLIPVSGGRHYGSATTGESRTSLYYRVKNETAVLVMYAGTVSFLVLMRALGLISYSFLKNQRGKGRAFLDGVSFGRTIRRKVPGIAKNAMRKVPGPDFSLSDFVFMHSRLAASTALQRKILTKMISKYHLD